MAQESFTLKELEELLTTDQMKGMDILKPEDLPEYYHFGGDVKEEQLAALKSEHTDTAFLIHRINAENSEIVQVPCSDILIDWRQRYMRVLEQICNLDIQEKMTGKEFQHLVGNMCARKLFNGEKSLEERKERLSQMAKAQSMRQNFKGLEPGRASTTVPNISNTPKSGD